MEAAMKTYTKALFGILALATAAAAAPSAANAAASFGFSFGTGPYGGGYYANPCWDPMPTVPIIAAGHTRTTAIGHITRRIIGPTGTITLITAATGGKKAGKSLKKSTSPPRLGPI